MKLAFCRPTPHITGSKKQSDEERGAALFTVRVHVIVSFFLAQKTLANLSPLLALAPEKISYFESSVLMKILSFLNLGSRIPYD